MSLQYRIWLFRDRALAVYLQFDCLGITHLFDLLYLLYRTSRDALGCISNSMRLVANAVAGLMALRVCLQCW